MPLGDAQKKLKATYRTSNHELNMSSEIHHIVSVIPRTYQDLVRKVTGAMLETSLVRILYPFNIWGGSRL